MAVEMIDTEINGRWRLLLPEHRAVRPEWQTGWERERLDSMHEHLSALRETVEARNGFGSVIECHEHRPVIVDVGVEEGDLTALYSQWGCDVVMVEPNPRVWPNIRAIWQANRLRPPLDWWVGFAAGATGVPQFEEWKQHVEWADDGWPACAHGPVIGDHAFLHLAQHAHMVPSIMLDDLCPSRVDAITMDVEGSELAVLRGAERILKVDRPLVWVSVHMDEQWMDENYPMAKRDDVLAFMNERGYIATLLAIDHEEHWFFEPEERT